MSNGAGWIIALVLLTAGQASARTAPVDSALPRLEREITRLAKGAGGVVGVSAIHLETNRRVSLNRQRTLSDA